MGSQLSNEHSSDVRIPPKLTQCYISKSFANHEYINESIKDKLEKQHI